MSKHARLSLAPPHRGIQDTAAVLSPRIRMGSPFSSTLSPTSSSMTHAVTTTPNNSNRLIVILQVSRRSAFLFSSAVSFFCKSYLQNTSLSTQEPPTASKLASDRCAFLRVVVSPCSRGRRAPHLRVVVRDRLPASTRGQRETLYRVLPHGLVFSTS